jgi:hypothetical protein
MSIGKGQAAALADGFLDDIGSGDVGDLQPRETISELLLLAGELVESAQDNLNASKSNASGELSKSILALEPKTAPGLIQIDIEMNYYGQFINKGVKGTRSGMGLYQFKHELGGRKKGGGKGTGKEHKLVTAMKQYIKDAKSKIGAIKVPIGYETKNTDISKQVAYVMASEILKRGIHPTYFMDLAIAETDQKVSERLGDALAIDVLNSLPDTLN